MTEYDIIMRNVTFTYKESKEPAIKDINFEVKRGEFLLISGPAGAGKTTICRCLNGLIPHFYEGALEGKVLVKGIDTKQTTTGYLSTLVGLLFQDPSVQLICPTIEDEIAFGAENYGIPPEETNKRVNEIIKFMRLEKYLGRNPHTLSGGEQQAVALGAIMAMRPRIYVLDEPTSNLDPIETFQVFHAIKELARREQKTVVIVSHKLEMVTPIADKMIVLDQGQILLMGTPRECFDNVETMEKIGLKPPSVSLLFKRLEKEKGLKFDKLPLTEDEAYRFLQKFLRKRIGATRIERITSSKNNLHSSPIIEVKNLWFTYPHTSIPALKGINLRVYEKEFIGLIGMNGSGKTTLVKHFNGLLKPTKGKIFVFGKDTATTPTTELSRYVGYVFQNPDYQIFKRKVSEEVAFGPKNLRLSREEIDRRVKMALKEVNCEHLIDKDPFELSMGEKQRINLAAVIAMEPKVLVVDEPTTGQDFLRAKQIMEIAKKFVDQGKTVIVISHDMDMIARYVERVLVMVDGQIIYDASTRETFSHPEVLEKTYIRPPQITMLAQKLKDFGMPPDVLTIEEAIAEISQLMECT